MTSHKILIAFQKCDIHTYNTLPSLTTIRDPMPRAKATSIAFFELTWEG